MYIRGVARILEMGGKKNSSNAHVARENFGKLKRLTLQMLPLKTSATSPMNGEWEKAGDSRASRSEGKGLHVRIYTPPAFKVLEAFSRFCFSWGNCAPVYTVH